jgi:hypothetical protein
MKTCKQKNIFNLEVKTMGMVTTNDGIRMTYAEWLEMVKAERN